MNCPICKKELAIKTSMAKHHEYVECNSKGITCYYINYKDNTLVTEHFKINTNNYIFSFYNYDYVDKTKVSVYSSNTTLTFRIEIPQLSFYKDPNLNIYKIIKKINHLMVIS